jgi:hypothetical protein
MKIYQYILLFFLISIICRVYYLFFRTKTPNPVKNEIEGFESLDSCLDQGYPDNFCNRIPLQACIKNCPIGTFMPKVFTTF